MCILSRAWRVHCMSRCFRLIEQPAGGGRTRHTGAPSLRPVTAMLARAAARLLPASAAETGAPPPSSQLARSTFLATDAQPIVHQATGAADAPWLRDAFGAVFVQRFARGKYDPTTKAAINASVALASRAGAGNARGGIKGRSAVWHWLEQFAGRDAALRDRIFEETMLDILLLSRRYVHGTLERAPHACMRMCILEERMLDILLLSRSTLVVGQFFGNLPRVALQMHVSWPPAGTNATARQWPRACTYVSVDGRAWCKHTFCTVDAEPL